MSEPQSPASGDEQAKELERQLESIAEQYLNKLQAGETPDRKALIHDHPDIAQLLERRLTLLELLYRAAQEYPLSSTAAEEPNQGQNQSVATSTQRDGGPSNGSSRDRSASSVDPSMSSAKLDKPRGAPSTVAYYPVAPKMRPDRYVMRRLHARGGMGEIWLADDNEIGRQVAIKRLRGEREAQLDRFFAEAQITGQLEHPNIVPVHDLGVEADGQPFYVMKFVEGRTLRNVIDEYHADDQVNGADREVQRLRLLEVFVDLCHAVAYAHSQGVLHRDLKPDNVMLGPYGETLLLDWGLAKVTQQPDILGIERTSEVQLTRSGGSSETRYGSVLGTPSHMSPELADGRAAEADERTDVYLLGATLYQILTGQPPRRGSSHAEMVELARSVDPPPPRQINRLAPRPLNAICQKAMARRLQSRYATALALAEDVQRYLAGEAVSAYREGLARRTWRWCKQHRRGLARGATAAILVALAAVSLITLHEARLKAREARWYADRDKAERDLGQLRDDISQARFINSTSPRPGSKLEYLDYDWHGAIERIRGLVEPWGGASLDELPLQEGRPALRVDLKAVREDLFEFYLRVGDTDSAKQAGQSLSDETRSAIDHFIQAERYRANAVDDSDDDPESLHQAIKQYQLALKSDPGHTWSYLQLGRCYQQLGQTTDATDSLLTFLSLRPDTGWARGLALAYTGQLELATRELDRVIGADQDSAVLRMQRAVANAARLRADPSFTDLERDIEDDLKHVMRSKDASLSAVAEYYLGRVHLAAGRFPQAKASFSGATSTRPSFRAAHLGLAEAQLALNDKQATLQALDNFLQLRPSDLSLEARRGRLLRELRDSLPGQARRTAAELGIEQLNKAAQGDSPGADVFYDLGRLHEERGQMDDAIDAYRKGVERFPENVDLLDKLGWAYALHPSGVQHKEALAAFAKAIEAGDDDVAKRFTLADAHVGLGYVHATLNRPEDALRQASRAAALLPFLDRKRYVKRYLMQHNLACIYGELSKHDAQRQDEYQQTAILILTRALDEATNKQQRKQAGAYIEAEKRMAFPPSMHPKIDKLLGEYGQ